VQTDKEFKRINTKMINEINSNEYKYLNEFKEKRNEFVKYVRKKMQVVEADFDKGTEIMKNSNRISRIGKFNDHVSNPG
jgi:CO dehydrogenase nickel-insertion accessory protein CooC1